MSEKHQLIAYLSTLACLALVFTVAIVAACIRPDVIGKMEVFGLGTITGGLIGVLRLPQVRAPVAATQSGDVNVGEKP